MSTAARPKRGDTVELQLGEIDERGRTLGRHAGRPVAVRGGVLGSRVIARVTRARRGTIEASCESELERSAERVPARCPHVASCGGCSFQELAYAAQLLAKGRLLARVLAELGADVVARIEPVIGCASPWNYRNKMDFTFGSARWIEPGEPEDAERAFALGLHARGHFHKVLDVRACEIAFHGAAGILASVRAIARARGLAPWDVRTHEGLLRHLVLRRSWATGEVLADLVTTEAAPELVEPLAEELLVREPAITTLVQHVNPGVAMVASGALARVFRGSGAIEERLRGLGFAISAHSFFQTNTPQAERLAELVSAWADPGPGQVVYDLYCGCGVFALALARAGSPSRVVGFELVESAIADARANAARNGLLDVRFVAGDLAQTLEPGALERLEIPRADVCVVDPPRAGLHHDVLRSLCALAPARIVYVSCNARSAVRDVGALAAAGWRVTRVQPIDLFPHTPHLECVLALERSPA